MNPLADPTAAPSRPRPPRPGRRLRLEALEGREVPATLTVTSLADTGPGSLRAAVAASHDGDLIAFSTSLGGKTIKVNSEIVVDHTLTIDGMTGAFAFVRPIISGGKTTRVFDITSPTANVVLEDLMIQDGFAGSTAPNPAQGGSVWSGALSLTVTNVMFTGAKALGGNGLPGQNGGAALGGALYHAGGDLTIRKSSFTGNIAQAGNGGALGGAGGFAGGGAVYNSGGKLTLDQNTFSLNYAFGGTGGRKDVGPVEAANTAIVVVPQANGSAGGTGTQGGSVLVQQGIGIAIAGGNGGDAAGGAVYNSGGPVVATKNTFSGNTAWGGLGGQLSIERLVAANLLGLDATQLNVAIDSVGVTQGGSVTVAQAIQVAIGDGSNGGKGMGGGLYNVGGPLLAGTTSAANANTYSRNVAHGGMGGTVSVGGVSVANQAIIDATQTNLNEGGSEVTQGGPVTVYQQVSFSLAGNGARGGDGLGGGVYNTAAGSSDYYGKYQSNSAVGGRAGLVTLQGGDFANAAYVNGSQVNVNLGGSNVTQGGNVTVIQTVAISLTPPKGGDGKGGGFYNTGSGFVQVGAVYTGNKAAGGKGGWLLLPNVAIPPEGDGVNPAMDTVVYLPVLAIPGPNGSGQGGGLYNVGAP